MTNSLSSINVTNNLPAYIRDDANYSKFISFLESYYDWFNDSYNLRDFGDNIDIDNTLSTFIQYFNADFLPGFPPSISVDIIQNKVLLLKIAKEFFMSKGTNDSFRFLFRALFNTDIDLVLTQDFMLIASGGNWIAPKSIKIKSIDPLFLTLENFKVFGTLSKTFGIIESSRISGKYIQLYLSDIKRLFFAGEPIVILNSYNQQVYQLNGSILQLTDSIVPDGAVKLESKIIGSLSSIIIDPNNRGQYANVGDPVVLYGGLLDIQNPVPATAIVSEVTSGGISAVHVTKGGTGYLPGSNSDVTFYSAGVPVPSATAFVAIVDYDNGVNTSILTSTLISSGLANVVIGANTYSYINPSYGFTANSNVNSTLISSLIFQQLTTYPIKSINVTQSGGGFTAKPVAEVHSYVSVNTGASIQKVPLDSYGILAPITIIDSGSNYRLNDVITISGGTGSCAFANITHLNSSNGIANVSYIKSNGSIYPEGGMGYSVGVGLPSITITSATGANAILSVTSILSSGAEFVVDTVKAGEITKITVVNSGEDYTSTPNVSVRILDIVASNIGSKSYTLSDGYSYVFQGNTYNTASFSSKIASVSLLNSGLANTIMDDIFTLRTYDYLGTANSSLPLFLYNEVNVTKFDSLRLKIETSYLTNGIKTYGSGTAKATARFLNGIIVDSGFYLSKKSLLSENSVLQSSIYNKQTYILSLEKSLDSYKNTIKSLVHPIGTQSIFRNLVKSNIDSMTEHKAETISSINNPSFSIDFSIDYTVNIIDPHLVCNRLSIATYTDRYGIVKYAANNVPRIDYVNGVCKGLLIEESRTNLLTYSQDFSSGWVGNQGGGVGVLQLADYIISPNGSDIAYLIKSISALSTWTQLVTVAVSTTYTFSFYYKTLNGLTPILYSPTQGVILNANINKVSIGNGWYRYSNSFTSSITNPYIGIWIGGVTQSAYYWGAQLEAGAFATSYIPTTTTTKTRPADLISIPTASSWYNTTAGTISVTADIFSTNTTNKLVTVSDGSSANYFGVTTSNNKVNFNVIESGVSQANGTSTTSITSNTQFTYQLSLTTNQFIGSLNHLYPIIDSLGSVPYCTVINIGSDYTNSANIFNGHIKQFSYYPRALSSNEIQGFLI